MKSKKSIIISLDISTVSTGWSVFNKDKLIKYGTITIDNKDIHERMLLFKDALTALIKKYKPNVILIEDVWWGTNATTSKTLAKFCGIAEETIFRLTKIKPIIIVNQSVKGFFKCKKKKDLYHFVVMLLNEIDDLNSFSKHNDITDSIAQAYYYINKNIKQLRYDKDYGFIYII